MMTLDEVNEREGEEKIWKIFGQPAEQYMLSLSLSVYVMLDGISMKPVSLCCCCYVRLLLPTFPALPHQTLSTECKQFQESLSSVWNVRETVCSVQHVKCKNNVTCESMILYSGFEMPFLVFSLSLSVSPSLSCPPKLVLTVNIFLTSVFSDVRTTYCIRSYFATAAKWECIPTIQLNMYILWYFQCWKKKLIEKVIAFAMAELLMPGVAAAEFHKYSFCPVAMQPI